MLGLKAVVYKYCFQNDITAKQLQSCYSLPPYSNGLGSEEWWWWWGWTSPECQGRHQRSLQIWGNTSLAGLMGLNWVNFRIRRAVKCGQNYKVEMFQLSNSVWQNILFLLNFLTAFNVYDLCLVAAPTSLSLLSSTAPWIILLWSSSHISSLIYGIFVQV